MEQYQQQFIEMLLRKGAVKFGEFTLKSGRKSPYFVNTGSLNDGEALSELGKFYASAIVQHLGADGFKVVFGPAYKGIPLSDVATVSLWRDHQIKAYASSFRKEAKDHGDKGNWLNYQPQAGDKVVIVDDVFTTGQTKEEAVALLKPCGVEIVGVLASVDRMEAMDGASISAAAQFTQKYGIPVYSIVSVRDIIEHAHNRSIGGQVYLDDGARKAMEDYLAKYGVKQ